MVLLNRGQRQLKNLYLAGDFSALLLAGLLSMYTRFQFDFSGIVVKWYYAAFAFIAVVDMLFMYFYKLYDLKYKSFGPQVSVVFQALLNSFFAFYIVTFFYRPVSYSRLTMFWFAVYALVLLLGIRYRVQVKVKELHKQGVGVRRLLAIGVSPESKEVLRYLREHPEFGLVVSEVLAEDDRIFDVDDYKVKILAENISAVLISLKDKVLQKEVVRICEEHYKEVLMVPDIVDIMSGPVGISQLGSVPLITFKESPLWGVQGKLKRLFDMFASLALLLLLSPFLLALTVVIKVCSPGPAIFAQERLGSGSRRIRIYKFRTMVSNADEVLEQLLQANAELREEFAREFKLKDDPRITPMGNFLRKTSLDELPQLFNVLKGEMSLVGPRPIVPEELDNYDSQAKYLLRVPPGLTGLWQVSGRNDIEYAERVKLDMFYINNWSFWLDLVILLRTLPAVLMRKGAY